MYQGGNVNNFNSLSILKSNKITGIVDLEGSIDDPKIIRNLSWYLYWPIKDGPLPNIEELWGVAEIIDSKIRNGMKVLVHCLYGVNRASLVNGCVLYLRGFRGQAIINKIKTVKPGALTNKVFENYLISLKK